ncbi:L-serine ammonia-lyase, iron-sulfur-dependent subunit beta [Streptococcaceae bacterium ESL0687]|nr:L-serine ammonia-lyase, iron-sulfur-dependent subunit beta [Streptococcaceae bacterium ESL0687]
MENIKFKSVFDIIGPVMIGPSSSHTAGAVRIGKIVRSIFGEMPSQVDIHLYQSFAKTYKGHGTDVALVAGLLGMDTDDPQIPESLKIAHDQGMEVSWIIDREGKTNHPNTAKIIVKGQNRSMSITGISIGGGNIQVTELNGFDIALNMNTPTLIIVNQDIPGVIAKITNFLSQANINVAQMNVTRESAGEKAIMMIEVDSQDIGDALEKIKAIPHIENVNFFK